MALYVEFNLTTRKATILQKKKLNSNISQFRFYFIWFQTKKELGAKKNFRWQHFDKWKSSKLFQTIFSPFFFYAFANRTIEFR